MGGGSEETGSSWRSIENVNLETIEIKVIEKDESKI